MKKFKNFLLPLLAVGILFTGCKKDDEDDTPKTNTEKITAHGWIITSAKEDDGNGNVIDYVDDYDPCDADDVAFFRTGGIYIDDEGATKCDPDDPQTISEGTWSFKNNETVLAINYGFDDYDMNIITLSESQLVLQETYDDGGVTYTVTVTYRAQ